MLPRGQIYASDAINIEQDRRLSFVSTEEKYIKGTHCNEIQNSH